MNLWVLKSRNGDKVFFGSEEVFQTSFAFETANTHCQLEPRPGRNVTRFTSADRKKVVDTYETVGEASEVMHTYGLK